MKGTPTSAAWLGQDNSSCGLTGEGQQGGPNNQMGIQLGLGRAASIRRSAYPIVFVPVMVQAGEVLVWPRPSVTWIWNAKNPAWVGMPPIEPVDGLMERDVGSEPPVIV